MALLWSILGWVIFVTRLMTRPKITIQVKEEILI